MMMAESETAKAESLEECVSVVEGHLGQKPFSIIVLTPFAANVVFRNFIVEKEAQNCY